MENRIEIKKRTADGVLSWQLDASGITPNTEIVPEKGLTVLLNVNGELKMTTKQTFVNSLFNPGKGKKLFGNKPYEHCELYVIDQSSSFEAEWGLGGPTAIPCRDAQMGVDCTAAAFGKYTYTIESFLAFKTAVPFKNGVITREAVREFLRTETTDVIRTYLVSRISGKHLPDCAKEFDYYQEDIKEEINRKLLSKGLKVSSFGISALNYSADHQQARERANQAKRDNYVQHIENLGKSEKIDLAAKEISKVTIPLMEAERGGRVPRQDNSNKNEKPRTIRCPRCHAENDADANYCKNCNEKLRN